VNEERLSKGRGAKAGRKDNNINNDKAGVKDKGANNIAGEQEDREVCGAKGYR
jgi:hypothetical protein